MVALRNDLAEAFYSVPLFRFWLVRRDASGFLLPYLEPVKSAYMPQFPPSVAENGLRPKAETDELFWFHTGGDGRGRIDFDLNCRALLRKVAQEKRQWFSDDHGGRHRTVHSKLHFKAG